MITDLTLGLGLVGIGGVAAILLAVGFFGKKTVGAQASKWFMGLGVVAALLCVFAYSGVADDLGAPTGDQITDDIIAYDVSVAENEGEVYVYANDHRIVVAMSFNDTSDVFVSSTGVFALNWTMQRGDASLVDDVTRIAIGSVPSIDVTGASDEYIIGQNADDSFNVALAKLGGYSAYENMNVRVDAGESAWCLMTITLNTAAVAAMEQYESAEFIVSIAGEAWTISMEKALVAT